MKWFKAAFNRIEEVEIERFTDQCVWVKGRRRSRHGWEGFYPSWKEAHTHLLEEAWKDVRQARLVLQHKEGRLGNIVGMKQPESENDEPV